VFEIPLNGAPSIAASLDGGTDARDGMVALVGHSKKLVSVQCSSDGNSIISASEDGTARVWDVASRQTLHILRHPKAPISDIALIPRSRYSGQGRGDYGTDRKRAKTSAAPTFSKFLIGPGDRSGLKPWQGTLVSIPGGGVSKKRAVDVSQTSVHDDTPATSGGDNGEAHAALAKKSTELDRARAEVEEWKKLYGDLKSIVDRQLVDAP
jgi:pre-rRNA-processing protein IPI3